MTKDLAVKELNCAAEDLHEARLILGSFKLVNEMSTAAEQVRNGMDHVELAIRLLSGAFREPSQLSFVTLMRRHLAVYKQKLIEAGIGENVELLDAMLADMEPFLLKVVGHGLRLRRDGDRWNIYGPDVSQGPVGSLLTNSDRTGYSTLLGAEEAIQDLEQQRVDLNIQEPPGGAKTRKISIGDPMIPLDPATPRDSVAEPPEVCAHGVPIDPDAPPGPSTAELLDQVTDAAVASIADDEADPGEKLGYTDPDPEREGQDRYIRENDS
jgi:hypothetical protein